MSQVFGPSANTIAKVSLVALVFLVAGGLGALDLIHRSPYVRYTKVPLTQDVPFSHKHHTSLGIDCRYCHTSVEDSHFANVPPTRICMNCHNEIWKDSDMLEPVRESWRTGEPLVWNRVNDLPDFVYFNHSIHIDRGIGCNTCHGRIDKMPLTWREEPLFMKWCLDCHRAPEKFIRPPDEVFNMAWEWPKGTSQDKEGPKLVEAAGIDQSNHRLTDCWICHR
jgi:ferredoxin